MASGENQPREICCCGAYSWAKVIGVIQIIIYVLAGLSAILILCRVTGSGSVKVENSKGEVEDLTTVAIAVAIIGIISSIIGIVTGILLIKGANEKNTKYLTIWITFAIICYIWNIVNTAVGSANLILAIISLALLTAIYGFGFHVVSVLKREIREGVYSNGPIQPVKA